MRAKIGSAPFKGTAGPPATHYELTAIEVENNGTGYQPGDLIFLAGGTFTNQASVEVTQIIIAAPLIADQGTGYTVGDDLHVHGTELDMVVRVASIGGGGQVQTITLQTNGRTTTPTSGPQPTTGGTGTGCTINPSVSAIYAAEIAEPGNYTTTTGSTAAQESTTGDGESATFLTTWTPI